MYEVSQGKYCTKLLNQHNFICSKFYKLYKYNINISHNKTTGLCGPMTSNVFKAQRLFIVMFKFVMVQPWNIRVC